MKIFLIKTNHDMTDTFHLCTNPNVDGGKSPFKMLPHDNLICKMCSISLCHKCRIITDSGYHECIIYEKWDSPKVGCPCYKNVDCLNKMNIVCSECRNKIFGHDVDFEIKKILNKNHANINDKEITIEI